MTKEKTLRPYRTSTKISQVAQVTAVFFPKMNDFPNLKSGYASNLAVRIVRLSDKGLKLFFFAGIRD